MMKVEFDVYSELADGCSCEGFVIVENGDWIAEHKYESQEIIIKHTESGRFFSISNSRSGNHWSGYEYDDVKKDSEGMVELFEVKPIEVTVTQYVAL